VLTVFEIAGTTTSLGRRIPTPLPARRVEPKARTEELQDPWSQQVIHRIWGAAVEIRSSGGNPVRLNLPPEGGTVDYIS
jgi:hypothetical protein